MLSGTADMKPDPKDYMELAKVCRAVLSPTGDYFDGKWFWTAWVAGSPYKGGMAHSVTEAAELAKAAIMEYCDQKIGVPR